MDIATKFKRLDPVNLQYFTDYIRYLELKNNNEKTIVSKLWKIYAFLIWFDFKDAEGLAKGLGKLLS